MDIRVPALGESVTEATVAQWFKSVGDVVSADTPLVELETDKITLEVNAGASGRLSEIVAPEGANVEVGGLLARIEEAAAAAEEPQKPPPEARQAPPQAAEASAERALKPAELKAPPPLSPAVRKLVEEHHLDPEAIPGTGKGGRILKGDVLAWIEEHEQAETLKAPAPGAEPAALTAPTAEAPTEEAPAVEAPAAEARRPIEPRPEARREQRVRMTRLRRRIAERLKEAQNTAAMLTTFNEADLSKVIELRRAFRERFEAKHGVKLGFMSFFVRAAVTALKEIPEVNAEIEGDEIVYKSYYHIGVAVSAPQGLVVPVIRDAERLSFAEIEKAIAELSQKASEGTLSMADLSGGTFTISNGGIFGSLISTPIINPPQAAILGMHKIQERPVVLDGKVEIRPMMYLALTYDHRLVDGREAVTFLVRIKACIEDPQRMLLDL